MTAAGDCLSCVNNALADLPPRERVYVGPRWRVAHAFGTSLPGWLVVLPRRHVLALDELTPRERMVFELKHYQGLRLRTIGEMLNTTEETAKNTLFRATKKLRAKLAELR